MTWHFKQADGTSSLNVRDNGTNYAVYAAAMYTLKECMKAAGWTCIACGSGTGGSVYSDDDGPRITATVLKSNNYSWFAMQAPNNKKIVIIQRCSNILYWRIRVIYDGGVNEDGTATVIPSAKQADKSVLWLGSGTDASPTGATTIVTTTGGVAHVACDDANNYSFYVAFYIEGSKAPIAINLAMESLTTVDNDDVDPCVYMCSTYTSGWIDTEMTTNTFGWYRSIAGTYIYGNIPATTCCYKANTTWTGAMGVDPWTGSDQCLPMLFGLNWSMYGGGVFKGWSSNIYAIGTDRTSGSTRTILSAMDKIQIQSLLFPWDGVTTPA